MYVQYIQYNILADVTYSRMTILLYILTGGIMRQCAVKDKRSVVIVDIGRLSSL